MTQKIKVIDQQQIAVDDATGAQLIEGAVSQSGTWTEANSAAIKTAVEIIDNIVSGNEAQVDIVAPLPAGTNSIGAVTQSTHDNFNANANMQVGNTDVSDSNPLPITFPEIESTANSTTTPLGISGVFTGSWESIEDYDFLDIILYTDQNSATNGASIKFSTDGGTTTHKQIQNTITGGVGAYFYGIPVGAFTHFQIVYTNGTIAQTAFVIKTIKKRGPIPQPMAPIGATIDETLSAGLVRAIMAGKKDNGEFTNFTLTNDGYMKTAVQNSIGLSALTDLTSRQVTVATTATQLDAAPISGRKTISIKLKASATQKVYIGYDNSVTISNGYELSAGDAVDIEIDGTQQVWAIADTSSQTVCILEVA